MEIVIGIISLIATAVGVYIAYVQLKRTPNIPKNTELKPRENAVDSQKVDFAETSLERSGNEINQSLTVSGQVQGNVFQIGKIMSFEHGIPSPAAIALRSYVDSLTVVPDQISERIKVLEKTFQIGGYKESPPDHPEVVDKLTQEVDSLCIREKIILPTTWKQEYWHTGHIKAITKREKDILLSFLKRADEELLYWSTELAQLHNFQRSLFLRRFFSYGTGKGIIEPILMKLESAGLITQGVPSGGRLERDTGNLRHYTTDLTRTIASLLERSAITPTPPPGEYFKWNL